MRQVFRILAFVIAAGVMVQAAVMVYADAGMGRFITEGGVLDQATMERAFEGEQVFPEQIGLMLHAMNGMMVMPVLAVLALVASFFAGRGVWRWGLGILLLTALQITLGLAGHTTPFMGALHGINALLLFGVALYAGWRVAARGRALQTATAAATPGAPQAQNQPF